MRNVKPKKFIVFLRGIEPVTDVIFLKWSLRNLNKIQSSKYSRTLSITKHKVFHSLNTR